MAGVLEVGGTCALAPGVVVSVPLAPGGWPFAVYADGSARVDLTVDGSTPVVGGTLTGLVIPAGAPVYQVCNPLPSAPDVPGQVALVSAGAPMVGVYGAADIPQGTAGTADVTSRLVAQASLCALRAANLSAANPYEASS